MKNSANFILYLAVAMSLTAAEGASAQSALPGTACPNPFSGVPGNILHFDKIVFRAAPDNFFLCPPRTTDTDNQEDLVISPNSVLDIKVLDDPTRIADVKRKVADFLGKINCVNGNADMVPVFPAQILPTQIDIIDVDYAIVCSITPDDADTDPPPDLDRDVNLPGPFGQPTGSGAR